MSILRLLVEVLGPVVLVVGLGVVVGQRLQPDLATLSRVAYWVLGPAFVLDLFTTTEVAGDTALRLAVAGLAGMAAALVATGAGAGALGVRGRARSAGLMTGAYGNVGNTGLAITAFALGEQALPTAGVLMLVINIAGVTLGVALASMGRGGRGLGAAIRRAVLSPMPLAALVALAINAVDVDLPLTVARSTGLLADAMIPVMLLTLGVQLSATGRIRLRRAVAVPLVTKLTVAPLAAWLVAMALGLTGDDLAAVALQSAMPPAVFCVLVGIEYDLEPDLVTDTVVATTLASLVTLPVILALLT